MDIPAVRPALEPSAIPTHSWKTASVCGPKTGQFQI
jgi:hypothetical protein